MSTVLNLRATSESSFSIGIDSGAIRLRNNSSVLEVTDKGGLLFLDLKAKDITGAVITGNDVLVKNDSITLNSDATSLGADWKMLLARPASGMGQNVTYTLPATPVSGYFLTTDISGNLSWSAISSPSTADKVAVDQTLFNSSNFGSSGSVLSMFTLPANAVVHKVEVVIYLPFDSGTIEIGVSGIPNKYMSTTQSYLPGENGKFVVEPSEAPVSGTEAIQANLTGSPTSGSGALMVHYSIPA